jgi:hypothetical protein
VEGVLGLEEVTTIKGKGSRKQVWYAFAKPIGILMR